MPKYENIGLLPEEYNRLKGIQNGYIEKDGSKKSFSRIIKELLDIGEEQVKA